MAVEAEDDVVYKDLWQEDEVVEVIKEVSSRKSVDTMKLFGGSDGELPSGLSRQSHDTMRAMVDQCKSSFDSDVAPWVPKGSVSELLAALASEAAFCRTQRRRRRTALQELEKEKKERERQEDALRKVKKDHREMASFLKHEVEYREAMEKEKVMLEKKMNDGRALVEKEIAKRKALEDTLDKIRIKEIEARRRLDRARLKASALRGAMVSDTMEALVHPRFRDELDDDASSFARMLARAAEHLEDSGAARVDGDDKPKADDDTDVMVVDSANGESHSGENGIAHDTEMSTANGDQDETTAALTMPSKKEAGSPSGESTAYDTAGDASGGDGGLDTSMLGEERVESQAHAELRVLRNRVAMLMAEATEWRESAYAERRKVQLLSVAKTRLEDEFGVSGGHGSGAGGNSGSGFGSGTAGGGSTSRGSARPRSKRTEAANAALSARAAMRKRRKGKPHRAVSLSR